MLNMLLITLCQVEELLFFHFSACWSWCCKYTKL